MKELPLGIQSFRKIIENNYVYVDKTQYIHKLLNDASYYFLSRPRRFGKSLLLDTIAEAFGGDRELFKGLFLYDSGCGFEMHPVLRLDMTSIANETPKALKESLVTALTEIADGEGLNTVGAAPSDMFKYLIRDLRKKYQKTVVVLIDEYDKPILDHITDIEIAEENRTVLKGFYGILKSMDPYLRMAFITGVSKFTKTSIFSELNNMYDITMDVEYSNICGITPDDLGEYFNEHIEGLKPLDYFKNYDSVHEQILNWYDGYSWDGKTRVINPFSLLSFFKKKMFNCFWFSSGTPKFLISLIKNRPTGYTGLDNVQMSELAMDAFDIASIEVEPLLFQAGYLTVKNLLPITGSPVYQLKIPNFEVREAFNMHLLAEFAECGKTFTESAYRMIKDALDSGDLRKVLETMKSLFASIPYELHIRHEHYYHSIFYAMMTLLGFDIDAEVSTAGGRIDATLELADKAFVIEFKYEKCAPDATDEEKRILYDKALKKGMKQINDKGYAKKYEGIGKQVYKAVFAFLGRDNIEMLQWGLPTN